VAGLLSKFTTQKPVVEQLSVASVIDLFHDPLLK